LRSRTLRDVAGEAMVVQKLKNQLKILSDKAQAI
jgi:hypothetical protein